MITASDENAVRARVEMIGDLFGLTDGEVSAALASDCALVAFAARYRQSLDWLCWGDVRPMLWARHHGSNPMVLP